MKKIIYLSVLFLLSLSLQISAQEICDNAIDDDGDGLIDLNDEEDCTCNSLVPSSLIPNPSFEEMICCPTANEMLNCAVGWIQASSATTDYVHTCGGYLGNISIPAEAPLPFADGEGGVGFRDGQAQIGTNYKEYVGACLNEPMEAGVSYRIDFFVGFQDNITGSTSFKIALFASDQCSNLPFGGNNYDIGCPTNAGGYVELGESFVSGSNEWVNVVFEFVADQDYEVIVLGPSCSANSNYIHNPYFYVDRLAFAETAEFGLPFENISGSICGNDLLLEIDDDPENTYQWYQDGVAIIGETSTSLSLSSLEDTEGDYLVMITTPQGCLFSQIYPLLIPPYYVTEAVSICNEEYYLLGVDTLTEPGFYESLIPASDGCDSIVSLSLEVLQQSYFELRDTLCVGAVYSFHGINATESGSYEVVLENEVGCDSVLTLQLIADSGLGIYLPEDTTLTLGETIDLKPTLYDPAYVSFIWSDDSGNILSNTKRLLAFRPYFSTRLFLEAFNSAGCRVVDSMDISVQANYEMYIPNAFSPDGNGINDFFRFYAPASVARVNSFYVFNRWGGLVFREQNIEDVVNYIGWDGKVKGENAQVGVYCYMVQVLFLDGTERLLSGDVTLLR